MTKSRSQELADKADDKRQRFILLGIVIAFACSLLGPSAYAHSHSQNGIEVIHPWCPATDDPPLHTVVVSMKIRNHASTADRLIGAASAITPTVEIRGPGKPNDLTRINALTVKPGQTLVLEQNGPHIVLLGLKRQLDEFDSFTMTLIFERAGNVEVEVLVEKRASH